MLVSPQVETERVSAPSESGSRNRRLGRWAKSPKILQDNTSHPFTSDNICAEQISPPLCSARKDLLAPRHKTRNVAGRGARRQEPSRLLVSSHAPSPLWVTAHYRASRAGQASLTTDGWHAVGGKHWWQKRWFSLTKINGLCSLTCPHALIAVLLMCRCVSRPANNGKHRVFEIALMLRKATPETDKTEENTANLSEHDE